MTYWYMYIVYVRLRTGITGCAVLNASVPGVITSPNYPNNYENNEDCRFTLLASPGHVIVLTFDDFELESCFRCSCDSVTVSRRPGCVLLCNQCRLFSQN